MISQFLTVGFLAFASLTLSGCASGIIATGAGTTAYVANQENTISQQAKDIHIKSNIRDDIISKKIGYFKDIEVNVVNGEVLLLGIVNTPAEKRSIGELANNTKYVKRVYNKLVVDYEYSFRNYMNDSLIANMIRSRMVFSDKTYLSKLNIEVFNNVVYIFGVVGSDEEKYFAEKIARTGKGVITVFSFVRVNRK